MHYSASAFSNGRGRNTIVPKRPGVCDNDLINISIIKGRRTGSEGSVAEGFKALTRKTMGPSSSPLAASHAVVIIALAAGQPSCQFGF